MRVNGQRRNDRSSRMKDPLDEQCFLTQNRPQQPSTQSWRGSKQEDNAQEKGKGPAGGGFDWFRMSGGKSGKKKQHRKGGSHKGVREDGNSG